MKLNAVFVDVETLPFFESSWRNFLGELPSEISMSTAEFAKLAFHAGATAAFCGLAQHDKDCRDQHLNDDEDRAALEQLALEPLEYLHSHGLEVP